MIPGISDRSTLTVRSTIVRGMFLAVDARSSAGLSPRASSLQWATSCMCDARCKRKFVLGYLYTSQCSLCVSWVSNENAYRRCTPWHSYTVWYAQDAPNVSRQCIPQSQMTGVVPSDTLVIALMWWALLNHDGWVHSINARAYPFHVLTHTDEPCLLIYRHKKCTTPSISSSNISKTYRVLRLNALLIWHKRTYRVSLYVYP